MGIDDNMRVIWITFAGYGIGITITLNLKKG